MNLLKNMAVEGERKEATNALDVGGDAAGEVVKTSLVNNWQFDPVGCADNHRIVRRLPKFALVNGRCLDKLAVDACVRAIALQPKIAKRGNLTRARRKHFVILPTRMPTINGTLIVPCGGAGRRALKALAALGEPVVLRLAASCPRPTLIIFCSTVICVAILADQNRKSNLSLLSVSCRVIRQTQVSMFGLK